MDQIQHTYNYPDDYQMPGMARRTHVIECEIDIAVHAQKSEVVDLAGYVVIGLLVPTIDSGALHFYASDTAAGTFRKVTNESGTAWALTTGTGNMAISADDMAPICAYRFVYIEAQTEQTAPRTFKFVVKG